MPIETRWNQIDENGQMSSRGGAAVIVRRMPCSRLSSTHLLVARDEVVILDMEAGIEHLGRGTAGSGR